MFRPLRSFGCRCRPRLLHTDKHAPTAVALTVLTCVFAQAAEPVVPAVPGRALNPVPVASPLLAPGGSTPLSGSVGSSTSNGEQPAGAEEPRLRRREGSEIIDGVGRFERRGDRVAFLTGDRPAALIVLENLALERVLRVTDEDGLGPIRWRVTGTITEFRGANYLMIRRAVVKSDVAPPPAKPDGLAERIRTELADPSTAEHPAAPRF